MKYLLIPIIGLMLNDTPKKSRIHISEIGLTDQHIEFLKDHDAYEDLIDAFDIDTTRVDFN